MKADTKFGALWLMLLSIYFLWQVSPLGAIEIAVVTLLIVHIMGRNRGSW